MTTDRALPANVDAERAVLGSVLVNRDALTAVAAWLKPQAFYLEKHAWIYEACLALFDAGTPPELMLVAAELTRQNRLDLIGGIEYLLELETPTSYHIEFYARLVLNAAGNRGLIVAGDTIVKLGYLGQDGDPPIGQAQAALDALAGHTSADEGLLPIGATVEVRYRAAAAAMDAGEPIQRGVPTGFRDLDELTGGLHATDFILVGARPSVGKSSWLLTAAYNASRAGARGGIFSLEMSREQCVDRLIAIDTGLNTQQVRLGRRWSEKEYQAYMEALGRIDALPLAIDERAALNVADIRSRALRYASLHGALDFVMVDYIGLMGSVKRAENRVQEISEVSRGLKQLAKELHCPVIAAAQLNRAVEGRTDHRPMLSDLRDSGSLEQDADIVMFLYREELYDKETDKKGIAEIHIAKHRNGPVGVVPLRFEASTTRFLDLSYRDRDGY